MSTVIGIDASRANRVQRTGVEWYAFHLIQRLKKIVPGDVRVVLYSEEPLRDGLETLPPNWESRVLRWPPRYLWTVFRMSWEMLLRPPDILFVPAHVPPLLTPRKTLTTLHDTAFVTLPAGYTRKGRAFLQFFYHVAVRAGKILTVSEFSKRELVKWFHARPEDVTVTPLGFDPTLYRATHDDAEVDATVKKYGLKKPYFLFVGRLETKKNLVGLLESFRGYRLANPAADAKLLLIGKPGKGYDDDMRALGEDIWPHVFLPGYVPREDMAPLYAGATAFLFISHYEGFGIPLLEAFASGTPVISSNVTSLPEVAGDAALYVSPNDHQGIVAAMMQLSENAALRESLRQKGFERLKNFSWEKTAQKTWEVLADMIEKK